MILIKLRETNDQIIYSPYLVKEINPETGQVTGRNVIYRTDSNEELEEKLRELIKVYPADTIQPVSDLAWMLEVVLAE